MIQTKYTRSIWFQMIFMLGWAHVFFAQQNFLSFRYSTKDGLSSEHCRKIYKDKSGFVWISSNNGLNRYDGNSFFVFKHDHQDRSSIASNRCISIFEDSKGQLWVTTDLGISLFDKRKQSFVNFYPDIKGKLSNTGYTEIAEDHLGRIWIGGQYDVLIFDPKTKKFTTSGWFDYTSLSGVFEEEMRNSISQSIMRKSDDELWIMTVYGLFSVHTPTMKFHYHPHPKIKDFFAFEISYIDKDGIVWITTYDQCFYSYNSLSHQWQHHECPPGNERVINIVGLDTSSLFIGFVDGIKKYNINTKDYFDFDNEKSNEQQHGSLLHFQIFENELYFIQTGIFPFVHQTNKRKFVQHQKLPMPSDFNNNQSFVTKSGDFLIGDWDKKKVLLCNDHQCQTLIESTKGEKLGALQMYFVAKDGRQFISTSSGCFQLSGQSPNLNNIIDFSSIKSKRESEFRNFVEDQKGNIYIRDRNNGIFLLQQGSQLATILPLEIGNIDVGSMYYDFASSKLWLCSDRLGLHIVDLSTFNYKTYPLSAFGCSRTGFINDIKGDKVGNVYLLINGCGMVHIKSSNMQAKLYSTTDGLLTDGVSFGIVDARDIFWFSSETGLMAFDHKQSRVLTFDDNETKNFYHRLFLNNVGNVAQNFDREIITFQPVRLDQETNKLKLYIKEISLLGKKIEQDSVIQLSYLQNSISLSFGYLGTAKIDVKDFEYRINQGQWQPCRNMNLQLYNLDPNTYDVMIRYKYLPESNLKLKFIIGPPWWKTWWFYTLVLLCTAIAILLAYRQHIHNVRIEEAEKKQLQQRIVEVEMRALRSQMNPHFIFNCLNSINRFILSNETDFASEYLTKFSRLIRLILDGSRIDFVHLHTELEALRLYIEMEAMRFQDSFTWHVKVDSAVNLESIFVPSLILQPFVENAIWHGLMQAPSDQKKKLAICVFQNGNATNITIRDNGIGRKKANLIKSKAGDLHKSYGIEVTQERLLLMDKINGTHSTLYIEDLMDQDMCTGTKVTITLNNKI